MPLLTRRMPSTYRAAVAVVVVMSTVGVLLTSAWFLATRPSPSQAAAMTSVCDRLPDDAAVLWVGLARTQAVAPSVTYCGVAAAGYGDLLQNDEFPPTSLLRRFTANAEAAERTPVLGAYGFEMVYENHLVGGHWPSSTVYDGTNSDIAVALGGPPRIERPLKLSIRLALVQDDGSLRPLRD